jgi:3-deoxy-manno-octulosonate cytidylyltransferase (CMP-KDO synthetase)
MTSEACLTGTDRVWEAAKSLSLDHVINVQGDEPLISPDHIDHFVREMERHPEAILNGMCPIDCEEEYRSSTIPKVVAAPDGRLLYMSRAAIPTDKSLRFRQAWKQVCVYVFPRGPLDAFSRVPTKTPLEAIEDIEVLRFLELGYEVRMLQLGQGSIAVDVPEDVRRVEDALRAR